MNSRLALTSFTRDYDYVKLCDIWSSKVYFSKFSLNDFHRCRPNSFFVYSSRFFFRKSQLRTLNLVITLIYDFKPVVIKLIPFSSLITTCAFAKDPFKPILFVGDETGEVYTLNLENLDDIQLFKPNFNIKQPVQLADWINEKYVLFSNSKQLFGWNIETGQINLVFECNDEVITYFTCSSFSPSLVAIGLDNGTISIQSHHAADNDKLTESYRLISHKSQISSLSFTVSNGKHSNPILASICQAGHLCVWNLDKKSKIFEDYKLNVTNEPNYKHFKVVFMDDLYDINDRSNLLQKTKYDTPEYLRSVANQQKKDSGYFILLVTNSSGFLIEYKVPKYLTNSEFKPFPQRFRIYNNKFVKVFNVVMPRSFQINQKSKIKKGDNQKFTNNNNYQIMIQVSQRNSSIHFLVMDLLEKREVEDIPTPANAISNIDFSRQNPNLVALPDVGGIIIWKAPSFMRFKPNARLYDLTEKRKGFFQKKCLVRVTCLNWHPDKENILAIGTRTGLIYVYDTNSQDPIEHSIQLKPEVYKSLYIYGIAWGPNVLERPSKAIADRMPIVKQTFDFIYCLVDDGKIVIINLITKRTMQFKEIADIFLDKQWSELSWKSDYSLLAVGDKEGSVDVFSNSLTVFQKLTHIITINDVFRSPIESISWHPIHIKSEDNQKVTSNLESQIAIAATENTIKIINLWPIVVESAKDESDLPLMVNSVDKTLVGHEGRVFRTNWSIFRENHLVSSSEDMTVKVWNCNMHSERELWKTYNGHFNKTLVAKWSLVDPDIIFSGGHDSIVSVWNVNEIDNEKPKSIKTVESACVVAKPNEFKFVVKDDDDEEDTIESSDEKAGDKDDLQGQYQPMEEGRFIKSSKNDERNVKLTITYIQEETHHLERLPANAFVNSLKNDGDKVDDKEDFEIENDENETDATTSKSTDKAKKRKTKRNESRVKSLLTLSTCYDNSLTKLEHFKDLDKMIIDFEWKKKNAGLNALEERTKNGLVEQVKPTFLLYGTCEDVENLSKFEIDNHLNNDDLESACLVKLLSTNLKTVIDEATKEHQLTDSLVAMSSSVSLDYWQQTTQNYVDQLIGKGRIVVAASYLLSLFRIKDALELLIKSRFYKEALMLAKTRFTPDNIYIRSITYALANDYSKAGNYESEAKCWISIDHYYEAARVLAARIDPLSARYAVRCCKIAFRNELEN